MAETQDPEEFVRLLLREAVDCSVAVISEQLLIKYNLDKISANAGSLAGSRFLEFAKTVRALVPVLFAKFKQFDALEIEAFRGMTDIRGHTSLQPYYRVGLTRTNSESINWPHIHLENVPAIADSFWEHPTKQSQFDRPVEEDNDP